MRKTSRPRVYIGKGTLEQLFESQAKVKLMKLFFRNPRQLFQLKDILHKLRMGALLIRKEIKKLKKIGLITEKKAWLSFPRKRGGFKKIRKIVFYLDLGFGFLKELEDLLLKSTISSRDELIDNVKKIGNVKLLALAGVFKGDNEAGADLLIVGDKINQRKFSAFLKDLEAEVGKELKCALMTSKEFNYRYDMYDRFVRDLISENSGILINKLNLW